MSRKMVVTAVAAAGVVGFGSAAVATVGPLGLGEVKEKLPGISNVDDRVTEELEAQKAKLPAPANLQSAIENLHSKLESGDLSLNPQSAQLSGDRLATALEDLAERVRAGGEKLSAAQDQGAEKLASQLERVAAQMRAASFQGLGGQAAVSGETAAQHGSGSVQGSGQFSSEYGSGAVAGGGSVSAEQALAELKSALEQVREMDSSNALSGGAGDILDRQKAEAALQRVTSELESLLG